MIEGKTENSVLYVALNGKSSWSSKLRAEIIDAETRELLPGLSLKESNSISGDHLHKALSWKEHKIIIGSGTRPIRIRFVLRNAQFYAFWREGP